MQVLQEAMVRQMHLRGGQTEIRVEPGTYITPQAQAYLREKDLRLITAWPVEENKEIKPDLETEEKGFQTVDGEHLANKPEYWTHLYGNVLVPKHHPRIILRGQLDALEGEIVALQCRTADRMHDLTRDLEEILTFCRSLMRAEVTGMPFPEWTLLGYSSSALREYSQHPKTYFGISHIQPHYHLGVWIAALNRLRTLSRQVELAAVVAFLRADGTAERTDLMEAYNRLSSTFYILMLRQAAAHQGRGGDMDE